MTCLTPIVAQNHIVRTLTVADPCAETMLGQVINELWEVEKYGVGCNQPHILYYATAVRATELLLLCDARQFDTAYTQMQANGNGTNSSRFDANSQSQSSGSGYHQSDSCAHARYDDYSRMLSERSSLRQARSCSHSRSFDRMADLSEGQNKSLSAGKRNGNSTSNQDNLTSSKGSASGTSYAGSCDKSYGITKVVSQANNDTTDWNAVLVQDREAVGYDHRTSESRSTGVSATAAQASSTESRTGASARTYCSTARSHSKSMGESCAYFFADVGSEAQSKSATGAGDDSQSRHHESANAAGAGESRAVSEARNESSAQMTASTHSDFDSKAQSERQSNTNGHELTRSQRFKNLREMRSHYMSTLDLLRNNAALARSPQALCRLEELVRDGRCDLLQWRKEKTSWNCSLVDACKYLGDCKDAVYP